LIPSHTSLEDSIITVICTGIHNLASYSFNLNIYPNPLKDATTISYILSENSTVKIQVCDIIGRSLATPVNHILEAGKYSVNLTPDNMNSGAGMYVIKMTVGNKVITRQVIILK
jgi:hypothetical protein